MRVAVIIPHLGMSPSEAFHRAVFEKEEGSVFEKEERLRQGSHKSKKSGESIS